ncbi:MAG: hypothetical protein M1828_003386 [Chrysothrix sp. TS-e1954]|nr:MAG: hypothetical protein M1828_003386 [Chrysothrix sp. TS-e1954]
MGTADSCHGQPYLVRILKTEYQECTYQSPDGRVHVDHGQPHVVRIAKTGEESPDVQILEHLCILQHPLSFGLKSLEVEIAVVVTAEVLDYQATRILALSGRNLDGVFEQLTLPLIDLIHNGRAVERIPVCLGVICAFVYHKLDLDWRLTRMGHLRSDGNFVIEGHTEG